MNLNITRYFHDTACDAYYVCRGPEVPALMDAFLGEFYDFYQVLEREVPIGVSVRELDVNEALRILDSQDVVCVDCDSRPWLFTTMGALMVYYPFDHSVFVSYDTEDPDSVAEMIRRVRRLEEPPVGLPPVSDWLDAILGNVDEETLLKAIGNDAVAIIDKGGDDVIVRTSDGELFAVTLIP